MKVCNGYISSIYHGSAVDGKGLRSVIFFSGCNMRCPFCHNPETLFEKGTERTVDEVLEIISRYKGYYKTKGGVTLSGGEPFLQSDFCAELINRLHEEKINIIAETNGLIAEDRLIAKLDGVRLDIKNFNKEKTEELIQRYSPFVNLCASHQVPISFTNVLIPTINDDEETIKNLGVFLKKVNGVKFEFLPFKKICVTKYKSLNKIFLYEDVPSATQEDVKKAYSVLKNL